MNAVISVANERGNERPTVRYDTIVEINVDSKA